MAGHSGDRCDSPTADLPAENVGTPQVQAARVEGRVGQVRLTQRPFQLRIDALSLGAELADMLPELGDGAALWHWQQLRMP